MAEEDELRKQQRVTILTPALIAILGLLGAAIAPAVQFVNGYWQNKLKEQEIAHLIVLDFAKLAIISRSSPSMRRYLENIDSTRSRSSPQLKGIRSRGGLSRA